ncbi:SusD-like starch-binding protein associating with outer membrane [Pontibacter mucosus]|uniref:SusD-like starch-binding protein associating with outer membrane n=1 Tax=Pontibacter mucosus TaxID=1649266 RepID=A0A2T5YJK8_9BACT|nr:RagB/SusD family nutrient uptake outer membrane protein [Pontibacter mucosus]PTX19481.1 SusD-like starch-binding protein associating with outer membrane [Pontibacter mucosus]
MKKIVYIFLAVFLFGTTACEKDILDLENPNSPGLTALTTEEGMKRAGLGVYDKFGLEYWWITLQNHDIMGDAYFTSVGNFGWRWVNQASSITLSDGTVLTPPQGGSQATELRNRNSRAVGDDNAMQYEWLSMYLVNNQANLILSAVENPDLELTGDAEAKKKVLRAWAYWWKGFAYSRIGSMYISGIIANTLNETNNDFVSYEAVIAEANSNFDAAIKELEGVTATAEYEAFLGAMIPSFTKVGKGGVLSPQEWIRNMNTYKARNILVNKKVEEMTAADWNAIVTLAENGIQANDKIFTMRSANENDLVSLTAWQPYRSLISVWSHISERLIQEYYPDDNRMERNFAIPARGYTQLNAQGRGFAYSTRYTLIPIEQGGDYASVEAGSAELNIAGSYEENQLMLAEAKIRLGQVEEGLEIIDAVRAYQSAGLPAVAGSGISQDEAAEVLRRERRVALLKNGVAFYDARRFGFLKPVSEGGGRTNAVVLHNAKGTLELDKNATIDYNYLERWDVPENELDFNAPSAGSAPVISPR